MKNHIEEPVVMRYLKKVASDRKKSFDPFQRITEALIKPQQKEKKLHVLEALFQEVIQ